jgi:hypothetical protein
MTKANRQQNFKDRFRSGVTDWFGRKNAQFIFTGHFAEPASKIKRRPVAAKNGDVKVYPINAGISRAASDVDAHSAVTSSDI